ncbi:MAG: aspartate ammonia-lyase [Pelosinus sp.]|nr:aspartate ammonia-lyase [Pelosinus sp.]
MRIEKDLLGEKTLPDNAYYGIHTLRASENFPLSGYKVHTKLIAALALIKKAGAEVNAELGFLDPKAAQAISQAADEVYAGQFSDQFIVDALQGGAGTSTNMNINEVIANRANELLNEKVGEYKLIHPLNHVNMGQSTNDVYPTALKIAAIWLLKPLSEACAALQERFQEKESEFAGIIKIGRTQLQDAVPVLLGQEFSAYAQAIARDRWRLYKVEERLRQVNLGGTAIGTGLNADKRYIYNVNERVRQYAKIGLARAENMIDATQNADVFVEVSGLIKTLAVNLGKIANDFRLLSSGPTAGFAEINLPQKQAGSSIMPGKVNPVIPEAVNQVAFHVMASDMAVMLAAQAGQLELNAFLPLIAHHLLGSIELLTNCVSMFAEKCVQGITANKQRCLEYVDNSLAIVTALVPYIGYDAAAEMAKEAQTSRKSIRQVVIEKGYFSETELNVILNPRIMTRPGTAGELAGKR